MSDITELWTRGGKLYVCAIKDVFYNQIVGWSINEHMKACLVAAVTPLTVSCTRTAARNFALGKSTERSPATEFGLHGPSWINRRQRSHGIVPRAIAEERARPMHLGQPSRPKQRDHHMNRTHLLPTPTPNPPRPIDTHRIRDQHDPTIGTLRLTNHCHLTARQNYCPLGIVSMPRVLKVTSTVLCLGSKAIYCLIVSSIVREDSLVLLL